MKHRSASMASGTGVCRTNHFHAETIKGEQEHPAMGALHPFHLL